MTPQQAKFSSQKQGVLSLYRELVTGKASFAHFLYYELATMLCSGIPGLFGLAFRSFFYKPLFKKISGRLALGKGCVVRIPSQISVGKGVLIDDYAVLDVRSEGGSIELHDHAVIGRFTTIGAKGGPVTIGKASNIGSYCRIATQSKITIGESVLVGAYSYIGPGNHSQEGDGPLISQAMDIKGGVSIGDHSWVGAGAIILDGVKIGKNCIVGAKALVKEDVPDGTTVVGIPARKIKEGGHS